jgi:recombination protein RecA
VADTALDLKIARHPAIVRLRVPDETADAAPTPPLWSRAELSGRLCELSTAGSAPAALTAAFALVLDAQHAGEPTAWITATTDTFFPPDVAASGVDLAALIVVRVPDLRSAGRAADRLLRSGGFGLVVLDLGRGAVLATGLQGRLARLAAKHAAAVVCLTEKDSAAPSLGSLVSLRAEAHRHRQGPDRFACGVTILKDKRRGPGRTHREVYRGPDGLR